MYNNPVKRVAVSAIKMGLVPCVLYFSFFCILTYPAMLFVTTHVFSNIVDGMSQMHGLWWLNKVITQGLDYPWYTTMLHYPSGSSLWGTSPMYFNGILCMFLLKCMTLFQAFNFLIVFSFVASGCTAFLLAYAVTGAYAGSLVAGYAFTFSSYHFAHAMVGHLNLLSLEWLPLFILVWHFLIVKPRALWGAAAALFLTITYLTDFYYFFICFLSACLMVIWHCVRQKNLFFIRDRTYWWPLGIFFLLALPTVGGSLAVMVWENCRDPFLSEFGGTRVIDISDYCMDALAPFIYGGLWRFAPLTQSYWSRLHGNLAESSCHLGWFLIILAVYVWVKRRQIRISNLGIWYGIAIFFILVALGPILHVAGKSYPSIFMPYSVFQTVFPLISIARTPVRLIVMAILCLSIPCAVGFQMLLNGSQKKRLVAIALLTLLFIESLPQLVNMPNLEFAIPAYVKELKKLPGKEAVMDMVPIDGLREFYQTIHERPLAFGYLARYPRSVFTRMSMIRDMVEGGNFKTLYEIFQFRYLVTKQVLPPGYPAAIFRDGDVKIYDLKTK